MENPTCLAIGKIKSLTITNVYDMMKSKLIPKNDVLVTVLMTVSNETERCKSIYRKRVEYGRP